LGTVAAGAPHFSARLAVDGQCVYFAAQGAIMKVAKP